MRLMLANSAITAALVLWLATLPVILFAPKRYAVFAWILGSMLDTTGASLPSNDSIGIANAFKTLGSPVILLFRFYSARSLAFLSSEAIWFALVCLCFIGTAWSPYQTAGLKMTGYLASTLVGMVVLRTTLSDDGIKRTELVALVGCTLGLGLLQTLAFAGTGFGYEPVTGRERFTSFVTPQLFAGILVAELSLVLASRRLSQTQKALLTGAIASALYWNGSRTWLIGAVLIGGSYLLRSRGIALCMALIILGLAGLLLPFLGAAGIDWDLAQLAGTNRVFATLYSLAEGGTGPIDAGLGTYWFRVSLYQGTIAEIQKAPIHQLFIGHGTSSGGQIALKYLFRHYHLAALDPNRVMHNEWLRVLYEWGFLGFGLLVAYLLAFLAEAQQRKAMGDEGSWLATMYFVPAFLIGLTTENALAGPGFLFVYACARSGAWPITSPNNNRVTGLQNIITHRHVAQSPIITNSGRMT